MFKVLLLVLYVGVCVSEKIKRSHNPTVFDLVNVTIYNRLNTPDGGSLQVAPSRDSIFLVHGEFSDLQNYVADFFSITKNALLTEGDYDIITVNWTQLLQAGNDTETVKNNVGNAGNVGVIIGKMIHSMRKRAIGRHNISIIAHDLGTVAIMTAVIAARHSVEYIYGINQRYFNDRLLGYLYLRQDMGKLVQTLSTNGFPFSMAHRDFYPNGGQVEPLTGGFFESYRMFAADIEANGTRFMSTVCPTFEQYLQNMCNGFTRMSFWNKISAVDGPVGKYYTLV